jgi:hypothetical protein
MEQYTIKRRGNKVGICTGFMPGTKDAEAPPGLCRQREQEALQVNSQKFHEKRGVCPCDRRVSVLYCTMHSAQPKTGRPVPERRRQANGRYPEACIHSRRLSGLFPAMPRRFPLQSVRNAAENLSLLPFVLSAGSSGNLTNYRLKLKTDHNMARPE